MSVYRFYLDVETQGLRTTQKSFQRTIYDPLLISQFSVLAQDRMFSFSRAWTNIFPEDVQLKHGLTTDMLRRDDLPASLLEEVTGKPREPFLSKYGFWDAGIKQRGNTVRGVLKRHLQAYLTPDHKRIDSPQTYVREFLGNIVKVANTGREVEVRGWNTGFDWGRIVDVAGKDPKSQNLLARIRQLNQGKSKPQVRVVDRRQVVSNLLFDHMLRDRRFTPSFTDYKKMDKIIASGISPTPEVLESITVPHKALRTFVDDIADYVAQKKGAKVGPGGTTIPSVFVNRVKGARGNQPKHVVDALVDVLQSIGDKPSYISTQEAMQRILHLERNPDYRGIRTLFDDAYKFTHAGTHVSLLGKSIRDVPMADLGLLPDIFAFTLGTKQASVAQSAFEVLGWDKRPEIKKMMSGAHDSDIDTRILRNLDEALDIITTSTFKRQKFIRNLQSKERIASGVLEKWFQTANQAISPPAQAHARTPTTIGQVARTIKGSLMKKPWFWLGAAALGTGMYILGQNKQSKDSIEGIRQSESEWGRIPAISASRGTMTDFGSGRDPISQLLGLGYEPQVAWLQASKLGVRGDNLYESIVAPWQNEDTDVTTRGTWVHSMVESVLKDYEATPEYYVSDPRFGVSGYIDILLGSGIPMEVKTVSDPEALTQLRRPKEAAISQANFYTIAMDAPHGYIAYFARSDPTQYKIFKILPDVGRLLEDREVLLNAYSVAKKYGMVSGDFGVDRTFKQIKYSISRIFEDREANIGLYPTSPVAWDAAKEIGDFGRAKRAAFYAVPQGGIVQLRHENALASKVRDQRTRLQRVQPMVKGTTRPGRPVNWAGRCESR